MSATSGRSPALDRRRRCSSTRPTARANTQRCICRPSAASSTPTPIPGSRDCSLAIGSPRPPAGLHVRRKFFDVHAANGSAIAKQALDRIGDLYGVEKTITGLPPDQRRAERQKRSKPIAEALRVWADTTLPKLSRKSELAKAFRYMRSRWKALLRCLDDGRLALDNNPAERALRCVAIGRKNYLFAGSDAGGRRAAALYSLIETAKLSGLDPQKYLADVLTRIADHPARQIADLLPWHWKPEKPTAPPREPASSPSGYVALNARVRTNLKISGFGWNIIR